MIVDDEVIIIKNYTTYLRRKLQNAEVYGALNSSEAFAVIEAHKPNILLVDLSLNEDLTGLDVFKKAKEANPEAIGAVITGNMKFKSEDECLAAGIKMVIQKPLPIPELENHVNELIKSLNNPNEGR